MSYTRFVILGQERTGSTLLQMLLNSDASVISMGEIFNDVVSIRRKNPFLHVIAAGADPIPFMENSIYCDYNESTKAVGFKLFYHHARKGPWSKVWNYLAENGVKIIHQKRRNLLDRYLSLRLAERTNQWILIEGRDRPVATDPIELDPHDCLRDFYKTVWFYNWADEFFVHNPMLEVYYEDLSADPAPVSQQVQDFLGLEPKLLSTKMVKQQRKTKAEMISNYTELRTALHGLIENKGQGDPSWMNFFDVELTQ